MGKTKEEPKKTRRGERRVLGLVHNQTRSNQLYRRLKNNGYTGSKEDFLRHHDQVVEYINTGLLNGKIFKLGRLGYLFVRMRLRKNSDPIFSCGLQNLRRANGDPEADGYFIPEKYTVKIMWSKYKLILPGSSLTIFRPAIQLKKTISKARKKGKSFIIWDEYESHKENINRQSDPGGPHGPGN